MYPDWKQRRNAYLVEAIEIRQTLAWLQPRMGYSEHEAGVLTEIFAVNKKSALSLQV